MSTNTQEANGFVIATDDEPVSARHLWRLAGAVDGYRDGRIFWLAGRNKPDTKGSLGTMRILFSHTKPSDDDLNSDKGEERWFGPYQNASDPGDISRGRVKQVIVKTCDCEASPCDCGTDISLPGNEYDAVFWTSSALEKFAVPHYVTIQGIEAAKDVMDAFRTGCGTNPPPDVVVHAPNTEYRCMFGFLGERVMSI